MFNFKESNQLIISTGNILNINKKAGQKAKEEVNYFLFEF